MISSQIDTSIVYNFSCHPNSDPQQLEHLPQLVTSFHPQLNEWSLHSHQSFLSQPLRADPAMIHVPFRIPVVPMQFVQWQDQILFVPVRQDLAAFPGMAFLIHHTDVWELLKNVDRQARETLAQQTNPVFENCACQIALETLNVL